MGIKEATKVSDAKKKLKFIPMAVYAIKPNIAWQAAVATVPIKVALIASIEEETRYIFSLSVRGIKLYIQLYSLSPSRSRKNIVVITSNNASRNKLTLNKRLFPFSTVKFKISLI